MGNKKDIKLRLQRREHVKERLKERFGINEYKYFFNKIKNKKFDIIKYLSNNRIFCILTLCNKDIYFILKKNKKYNEVLTILIKEMVLNRYYYYLGAINNNILY